LASPTPVLVTGGAGYVGAHTCLALAEAGFQPVVYDSLARGWREFVQWGPLEEGDIRDRDRLRAAIARHRPAAVLHFAALIEVGESVKDPGGFFDNNVAGAMTLIDEAQKAGVGGLVFSSTCATYGEPRRLPLDEAHPQNPVSPYGRSKLMVEQALAEFDRWLGFRSVALRYFNAAGADPSARIGEKHEPETHAIPNAIFAARDGRPFKLFGTDYDTRDGTAVRDYIHVLDLADAHVRALNHLLAGGDSEVFNLGTGVGTTVKELIAAIEQAGGRKVAVVEEPRRPGDAPVLVADNAKARSGLGWTPKRSLDEIVQSAWRWHVG
jgi:UDP-glucose 4-epimerase